VARRTCAVVKTPPEIELYSAGEEVTEAELVVADRVIAGILLRMWLKKRGNRALLAGNSEAPRAESA
jgi:hypothetical protein